MSPGCVYRALGLGGGWAVVGVFWVSCAFCVFLVFWVFGCFGCFVCFVCFGCPWASFLYDLQWKMNFWVFGPRPPRLGLYNIIN